MLPNDVALSSEVAEEESFLDMEEGEVNYSLAHPPEHSEERLARLASQEVTYLEGKR